MTEASEIEAFYDVCSDLMRELLDGLSAAPGRPRPFGEVEDAIGWPRRRIASVLGGVSHMRHTRFGGRRPYRFLSDRHSASGRWEIWQDEVQARAVAGMARGMTDETDNSGLTSPDEPTHEATTPPGENTPDEERVQQAEEQLEQAGGGH